ncbi:MAG: tail-specific protease [Pseudomonadales bacterium]|nr:tail-specific protease [Pseudomonadales bacterium]NIX08424.1 tail-specific protease [Pseudomonadales bacterium]
MRKRSRTFFGSRSITLAGAGLCVGAAWIASIAAAENPQLALSTPAETADLLSPLDVHPRISLTIVEQLRHNHYLEKDLDDQQSSHIFENYLGMLDGAKVYFTAADVAAMEQYRYKLDDALVRGNLVPAFEIFNRYQERLTERLEFLLGELALGLDQIDFTTAEKIEIERENAPWPADEAELDALWRKRLKAAALSMKLNGKALDEIQTLLTKRYANRLKQSRQTKSEDAFQLYVNAYATTYDPHTQYFSPRTSQNFNINMSLSLEGIGAVLRSEDEYTSIVELVPAGPADKSGLVKPADRIISVGQGETGPLIDVVGWRLDDVVELIRGPKGSQVRLEIIPSDSEDDASRVISITRNTVKLEEQAAQKKLLTMERNGQTQKIGVVEIPTFYVDFKAIQQGDPNYKSTTRDVRLLIEELKAEGIDGLVIDLRNNGGGALQEADSLTGLFIKSGPTVQVKSASRRPLVYSDDDNRAVWDGPLAVLVNRLSASASEIFAGAIQDYERGIIIGSQTFGKGTVQTLVPLNRGQLKITAAKFYRVSGQSTQHQGIIPDIEFPEIYDAERIGESALDDAMPWDMIQPAVYPRSHHIQPILAELNSKHDERAADDPDFQYFEALAQRSRENNRRTHISLNEKEREQQKKDEDNWRLDLENQLRLAKGEEPLASLDDLDDVEVDEEEVEDPTSDPMVRESANILLDYIGLTRQIAYVEDMERAAGPATTIQ